MMSCLLLGQDCGCLGISIRCLYFRDSRVEPTVVEWDVVWILDSCSLFTDHMGYGYTQCIRKYVYSFDVDSFFWI